MIFQTVVEHAVPGAAYPPGRDSARELVEVVVLVATVFLQELLVTTRSAPATPT